MSNNNNKNIANNRGKNNQQQKIINQQQLENWTVDVSPLWFDIQRLSYMSVDALGRKARGHEKARGPIHRSSRFSSQISLALWRVMRPPPC